MGLCTVKGKTCSFFGTSLVRLVMRLCIIYFKHFFSIGYKTSGGGQNVNELFGVIC